jgi:predicted Zn finger-like uncharacterized protein
MPISTNCPKCAALFRLPDELAGRRVKCQRCGQIFQAPAAGAPTAVSPSAPASPPSPPARPENPAPPATEEVIIDARLVSEDDAPRANAARAIQAAAPPPAPMDPPRSPERTAERPALPRRPRDEDRDERRRPPPARQCARSGTDPWVIVGIVGGIALLIGAGVAGFTMVDSPRPQPAPPWIAPNEMGMVKDKIGGWDAKDGMKMQFLDKAPDQPFAPGNPFPPNIFPPANPDLPPVADAQGIKIALTKGVYEAKHTLTQADPIDPRRRAPCKLFLVALEAGKTYVIDEKSRNFDAYLRLESAPGIQLAEDDDSGGNLDARIRFTPNQAGTFRVIATSLGGGFGEFTLAIHDTSVPEPAPRLTLAKIDLPKLEAPLGQLTVIPGRWGQLPIKMLTISAADHLRFAADGKSFYVLDTTCLLRQITLPGFVETKRLPLPNGTASLAVSAAGLVVANSNLQEIWLIDPGSFAITKRLSAPGTAKVLAAPVSNFALAIRGNRFEPPLSPAGGVIALDLVKGESLGLHRVPTQYAVLSSDGKYYFVQGGFEELVRYRFDGERLVREEASPRIAQNGQGINVGPDSKYVCLPSGGGNYGIPGHPRRGYGTFVFNVADLQKPAFTVESGAYPEVVGFDAAGGFVYAQNHDQPLLVFDFQGRKKAGYGSRGGGPSTKVLQYAPLPEGRKLLIRLPDKIVFAELGKDGEPSGAGKLEVRELKTPVSLQGQLTNDDPVEFNGPAKEFVFKLEAGISYRFECEAPMLTVMLRLCDDNRRSLQARLGTSGKATLAYRPSITAEYSLLVSALPKGQGPFTLTAQQGEAPATAPKTTPKVTAGVRNLIVSAKKKEAQADDELTAGAEPKLFAFTASTVATYTIEVTATGFAPYVKMTSAKGDLLQEVRAKAGENEVRLVLRPEMIGRVTIAVSADDKKAGKFTLTIKR